MSAFQHHCRKCGKVVCGPCSNKRWLLPEQSSKPLRVCLSCYDKLSAQGTPGQAGKFCSHVCVCVCVCACACACACACTFTILLLNDAGLQLSLFQRRTSIRGCIHKTPPEKTRQTTTMRVRPPPEIRSVCASNSRQWKFRNGKRLPLESLDSGKRHKVASGVLMYHVTFFPFSQPFMKVENRGYDEPCRLTSLDKNWTSTECAVDLGENGCYLRVSSPQWPQLTSYELI